MVAPSAIRNEHFLFVWVELLLKWYEEQWCYEYISLNYYIVLYSDTKQWYQLHSTFNVCGSWYLSCSKRYEWHHTLMCYIINYLESPFQLNIGSSITYVPAVMISSMVSTCVTGCNDKAGVLKKPMILYHTDYRRNFDWIKFHTFHNFKLDCNSSFTLKDNWEVCI